MTNLPDSIPVSVDKSHIVALGEKLYAESIELIRELVNNAYDADATEVRITVEPDRIVVEDDGSGMSYDGLVQYFNIGSPEKSSRERSPRFNRVLIGQFGIGKFASLAAARRGAEVRVLLDGYFGSTQADNQETCAYLRSFAIQECLQLDCRLANPSGMGLTQCTRKP